MPSITFDRFDGGLLLARPSSVAPANSLSNLFNVDVQPGGTLRSRPSFRRAKVYPGVTDLQLPSQCCGLEANGGYLWTFAVADGSLPSGASNTSTAGKLYPIQPTTVNDDYLAIGYFTSGASVAARLVGAVPWNGGFVVVLLETVSGTYRKGWFYTTGGVGGAYSAVFRTNITDTNMPSSGLMVTIGSRIYAISDDGQTVKFSAVGSPTDWTTSGNAGSLPVAQHFGSGQRACGLGVYQGKLAVFSDKSVQLWTVDPDPTKMAIDNVVDGVGTLHHGSIRSVNGDLFFLASSGVRSMTTLANEQFPSDVDIGLPVSPVTTPPLLLGGDATHAPYSNVLSLNAAHFGQYWIAAPGTWNVSNAIPAEDGWLAWTYNRQAKLNAWAMHGSNGPPRAQIKGWAALGGRVYMRNNLDDYLMVMNKGVYTAEQIGGSFNPVTGSVYTQWLDFKLPGRIKQITGIDFDTKNVSSMTVFMAVNGDRTGYAAVDVPILSNQSGWTYSGEIIPVEAAGTEFKFGFTGMGSVVESQINRMTVYFEDLGT